MNAKERFAKFKKSFPKLDDDVIQLVVGEVKDDQLCYLRLAEIESGISPHGTSTPKQTNSKDGVVNLTSDDEGGSERKRKFSEDLANEGGSNKRRRLNNGGIDSRKKFTFSYDGREVSMGVYRNTPNATICENLANFFGLPLDTRFLFVDENDDYVIFTWQAPEQSVFYLKLPDNSKEVSNMELDLSSASSHILSPQSTSRQDVTNRDASFLPPTSTTSFSLYPRLDQEEQQPQQQTQSQQQQSQQQTQSQQPQQQPQTHILEPKISELNWDVDVYSNKHTDIIKFTKPYTCLIQGVTDDYICLCGKESIVEGTKSWLIKIAGSGDVMCGVISTVEKDMVIMSHKYGLQFSPFFSKLQFEVEEQVSIFVKVDMAKRLMYIVHDGKRKTIEFIPTPSFAAVAIKKTSPTIIVNIMDMKESNQ